MTNTQAALVKGNPYDAPFEDLRKARKAKDDNRCHVCGTQSRMNTVNRVKPLVADSVDNLRTVCRKHDAER